MITYLDVAAERARRKMTRAAFGELVGLKPSRIQTIENGAKIKDAEQEMLAPHVPEITGVEYPDDDGDGVQLEMPGMLPAGAVNIPDTIWLVDEEDDEEEHFLYWQTDEDEFAIRKIHAHDWRARCPVCTFEYIRTSEEILEDWMSAHVPECNGGDPGATALGTHLAGKLEDVRVHPGITFGTSTDYELYRTPGVLVDTQEIPAQVVELPPPPVIADAPDPLYTPTHATGGNFPVSPAVHTDRPLFLNEERLISNSEVQTYKRCKRKWWLAWYRGLKLKAGSPVGVRSLGTRGHAALAAWYVPDGDPRTDPRDALEQVLLEDWTKLHSDPENPPTVEVTDEFKKDADMVRAMIEGYVQWIAETGADEYLTITAPEQEISVLWENTDLEFPTRLIGKLDVRAKRSNDGVRTFVDHKFVGNFTQPVRTLHMDEQMRHYKLLEFLDSEGSDERCGAALYNMLRRVKRSATAKPPFYERQEVRISDTELDSYQKRLVGTINDMGATSWSLDAKVDPLTVVYPSPRQTCSWDCDYLAVCTMFDDGSRAEDFMAEHYVSVNPLERYGSDLKGESSD